MTYIGYPASLVGISPGESDCYQQRAEVMSSAGSAILPESDSKIFSHFMSKSVDEIYETQIAGFPR